MFYGLNQFSTSFVESQNNGPNFSQVRPNEKQWFYVKRKYKKRSKGHKFAGLHNNLVEYIKNVIEKPGKNLVERLRVKLRFPEYAGLMEPLKSPKI